MGGFKLGWIVPVIVLTILITVIGVGIYQVNHDGNPWDSGRNSISDAAAWDPMDKEGRQR